MSRTEERIVGNRELILGIDGMYREAMKCFEVAQALPAAEAVARTLRVSPDEGPVEGYYAESPALTRYFQLLRSLQAVPADERHRVDGSPEFALLSRITRSPIFGVPGNADTLLPAGRDALHFALASEPPAGWSVAGLLDAARREALARNDCSLVGLSCRAGDAVCVAALRETAVLYAEVTALMAAQPPKIVYVWAVDPEIEAAANRLIESINALLPGTLRTASKPHAENYYHAARNNRILGRCVRLAYNDLETPVRHYHWAVNWNNDDYTVDAFWSEEHWTTERYRRKHRL